MNLTTLQAVARTMHDHPLGRVVDALCDVAHAAWNDLQDVALTAAEDPTIDIDDPLLLALRRLDQATKEPPTP